MGGAKEDWLELRLAWSVVRSFTHTYKERERERERERVQGDIGQSHSH